MTMPYVFQVHFQEIMAHVGDCKWMSWLPVLVVSGSKCLFSLSTYFSTYRAGAFPQVKTFTSDRH